MRDMASRDVARGCHYEESCSLQRTKKQLKGSPKWVGSFYGTLLGRQAQGRGTEVPRPGVPANLRTPGIPLSP